MSNNILIKRKVLQLAVLLLIVVTSACNTTKYLKDNQYLLKSNTVKIKSDRPIKNKGELKDNVEHLVVQKPNTPILGFPYKLWLYNIRYEKYQKDTTNFQLKSKTAEKPVIYDTALTRRSAQDIKSYMYNQGYFYSRVYDSVKLTHKKAYATYTIIAGSDYVINNVNYDADDSVVAKAVRGSRKLSGLQKNKDFTMSMLEDERGRITSQLRDLGYYRFSQENVTFVLDTVNKDAFKNIENPFEGAVSAASNKKKKQKPTLDVNVIIRPTTDSFIYTKYTIASVQVRPDYADTKDFRDSTLRTKTAGGVTFKYHHYYVKENVLLKHIYLLPDSLYQQSDYDRTIIKLNELGIFQYIRVVFRENKDDKNKLDCVILLNRTKKHDFSANYEVSSGSTYTLGNSLALNFRDRNLAKGANLLTLTASGGVELIYDENTGHDFFNHFFLLTEYYGLNASIDFPKFLAPIAAKKFDNSSLPHTIISAGVNSIDRLNYFTLINNSASFTYNWHQSRTITWDLSPIFVNIIRVPYTSDSFSKTLAQNEFLANTYKPNFIEGENLTFTYSDNEKRGGKNYSYLRLGIEEAGGVLSAINSLGTSLNNLFDIKFAQYTKLDFDARHYFTLPRSTFAFRFTGGIGIPYGQSTTLPYIKQYFVGGPYSLRGWRVRSLGPGSFYDPEATVDYIDRTGDIKLELNGEYRFFIANLFAGFVKFNGGLFADAGNIWLTKRDSSFAGGEFSFNTFGQDIAADIGTGARFDIASFLTLRLDVAIPVKKPYIFTNSGWVFDQIDFHNPSWRANNIIFNLSIGYPF